MARILVVSGQLSVHEQPVSSSLTRLGPQRRFVSPGIEGEETTLVMVPGDPEISEVLSSAIAIRSRRCGPDGSPPHDEITKISGIKRVEPAARWRALVTSALLGGIWPQPDASERIPPRAAAFCRRGRNGQCSALDRQRNRQSGTREYLFVVLGHKCA